MNEKETNEIVEKYRKQIIGIDEPFGFRCTMCGNCCRFREDILLNPFDFFRLVKGLGMPPKEVVEKYCECYIGESSRMPLIRLNPVGIDRRCPLLKGNRCAVHQFKPTVCAMFPIGRMILNPKPNTPTAEEKRIDYIFTAPNCGDRKEKHTVREWLGKFDIPLNDEFFLKWSEVLSAATMSLQELEKRLNETSMGIVWNLVFNSLYMLYDTNQEFLPQFEEFSDTLLKRLKILCEKAKEGGAV